MLARSNTFLFENYTANIGLFYHQKVISVSAQCLFRYLFCQILLMKIKSLRPSDAYMRR